MIGSASALGLDKMIDEKRDAMSMSQRVVHIEVRSSSSLVDLPLFCFNYLFSLHLSYQTNV